MRRSIARVGEFIRTSDPQRDEIELQGIAPKSAPQLLSDLKQKPGLTEIVDRLTAEHAATSKPAEAARSREDGPLDLRKRRDESVREISPLASGQSGLTAIATPIAM